MKDRLFTKSEFIVKCCRKRKGLVRTWLQGSSTLTGRRFGALITLLGGLVRSLLMIVVVFLSGCIAGKAGYQLVDTEKAFAAKEAGAEELAIYEYTSGSGLPLQGMGGGGVLGLWACRRACETGRRVRLEGNMKWLKIVNVPSPIGGVPAAAEPGDPEGIGEESSGDADAPLEELSVGVDSSEPNSDLDSLESSDEAVKAREASH